jgi:peptidoglycan-N-acetylglucosamine deacetylase
MPRDFGNTIVRNNGVRDVQSCAQDRIPLHESGPCSSIEQQPLLTVSIDDGHVSDFSTAELLCKFGLKATFYIPRSNPERPVMSVAQMRELGTAFDIGGHTLSHHPLPPLDEERAWGEIRGCKDWLEDVLGRTIHSFCYPRGKYNRRIRNLIKKAGFVGARTCRYNLNSLPRDPFEAGVSTEAFPHSAVVHLRHAVLGNNYRGLLDFFRIHRTARDWELHFHRALDWVETHAGVAHLYLHSWEIENQGAWSKLERVLQAASSRKRLVPATNTDVLSLATTKYQNQKSF